MLGLYGNNLPQMHDLDVIEDVDGALHFAFSMCFDCVWLTYLLSSDNMVKAMYEFEGQEGELSFVVRQFNIACCILVVCVSDVQWGVPLLCGHSC